MNWYVKVLKNYTNFTGRSRRKEYWMFVLINTVISIILKVLDEVFGLKYGGLEDNGVLETIYSLAVIVPYLAVGVRRMHDVGKSGWYLLIPIYNLILACTDSESESNKWGDNPKGIGNDRMINQIGKE